MLRILRDVGIAICFVAGFYGYFTIALDALEFETTGECTECVLMGHLK